MKNKTVSKKEFKKILKQTKKDAYNAGADKEVAHDYVCDNCGKPAMYNMQDWFNSYRIDNDGSFQEINDWEGELNEFYCKKCAEAEGIV